MHLQLLTFSHYQDLLVVLPELLLLWVDNARFAWIQNVAGRHSTLLQGQEDDCPGSGNASPFFYWPR